MISLEMRPRTAVRLGLSARELRGALEAMLRDLDCQELHLDVLVTGDREMAIYNKQFLDLVGPTNVLSFPAGDDGSSGQLGSLCLCAPAVFREAALYGQDLFEHLVRLLAHGLLHLLEMPHGPEMDEQTEVLVGRLSRFQPAAC